MYAIWGLILCLILLIYPFTLYPMLLRALPKVPLRASQPDPTQRFALFFAAHNEAAALPDTLADLRALKSLWPGLDIHAFDDASHDRTRDLLAGAQDILTLHVAATQVGKASGLTQMLAASDSDVALFMDANIRLDPASLLRFRGYFADAGIGAVGARLSYSGTGTGQAKTTGSAYWRLEEAIKSAETATGSTMGCDGGLWGIRRAYYPRFATHISDDFRPSMEPLFHGARVISAPDIFIFEAEGTDPGAEAARKRRIARGAWHAHLDMRAKLTRMPMRDRFKYTSHKFLRWFAGSWLLGAFGFSLLVAVQIGALMLYLAVLIVLCALVFARVGRFGAIGDIIQAMLATQAGILGAMLGQEQAQWRVVRPS